MLREPQKDETPTSLFNPLLYDFVTVIADDNNIQHTYTLHAQEIDTFPAYIANRIKKRLAEKIYLERTESKVTKESVMPEILDEIEVKT